MTNYYHILHKYPALESYEMFKETEILAQKLVKSGLLRIDALEKCNFVRFSIPSSGINIVFSDRQLTDKRLIPKSKKIILECLIYAGYRLEVKKQLAREWNKLLLELKKNIPIYPEWEIKIARLLVQSSHPIVTHLILIEQVEVFFSFGFEIGDIMDIQTWKTSGKNSGMQSTDGTNTAIYVSCGGNPFTTSSEYATHTTDGFPAIARTLIIAGQEMDHYSDIIRDEYGRQVSRHSADFGGRRAKPNVLNGRRDDIKNIDLLFTKLNSMGLAALARANSDHYYYMKHKFYGAKRRGALFKMKLIEYYFRLRCKLAGISFIKDLREEKYLGTQIYMLFSDMRFNLEPKADVYARENLEEEEAIACIEALARVPQQVNKWGHTATKLCMRHLYDIYYDQLIPSCILAYENMSGKRYSEKLTKQRKPFFLSLKELFSFKKKPKKEFTPLTFE